MADAALAASKDKRGAPPSDRCPRTPRKRTLCAFPRPRDGPKPELMTTKISVLGLILVGASLGGTGCVARVHAAYPPGYYEGDYYYPAYGYEHEHYYYYHGDRDDHGRHRRDRFREERHGEHERHEHER
jgi:hypothetical protein